MDSNRTTSNSGSGITTLILTGSTALHLSAKIWFVVALIGLWIFAVYLIMFYGGTAIHGDFEKWTEVLPTGFVKGDILGNIAIAGHISLALIILGLGPLQFVPKIRSGFRKFHRWNGRVYVTTGLITSLFGLYMVWVRGSHGDLIQHIGITGDALLIMIFAVITLRHAISRSFIKHNRWAFRLFLVMNAVWFFRIGLMFWIHINNGPVGFDPVAFEGPFLSFWTFGQYLLPLFFAELYFKALDIKSVKVQYAMAVTLIFLAIITGMGIYAATKMLWLPVM